MYSCSRYVSPVARMAVSDLLLLSVCNCIRSCLPANVIACFCRTPVDIAMLRLRGKWCLWGTGGTMLCEWSFLKCDGKRLSTSSNFSDSKSVFAKICVL